MKKILFMLPKTHQGGAETQMLYLLRNLDREKFMIYLGILYHDDQLKKEFESIENVKVVYFNKKNTMDISVFLRIASFVRKNKVDIVQAFLGNHYAYIPALLSSKAMAIGGIRATLDQKNLSFREKLFSFALPRIFVRSKRLILISNSYKGKSVYLKKGFLPADITVIPNGIDFDRFSKGNKNHIIREFEIKNKRALGMVGRLVEGKNHAELLHIFRKLSDKFDNLVLFIIGDGPLMDSLKALAKGLKLKNVFFTGNRKDIPDFVACMDLLLFPSKFPEGWPNAVGEAMAAGTPVVSYQVGDVDRIITNGYNGVITEPEPDPFIKNAIDLLKHDKKRKLFGVNAKKTIKENFSIEKMVQQYENFYLDIDKNERLGK